MGSRKSEKAIVEHVFVNFRVKNAVFTNFRDKNDVLTSFRGKDEVFELHDKNTLFGFKFVSSGFQDRMKQSLTNVFCR